MALTLSGKNPYIGILSKYSNQFQQFITELGDAKSKGEEDRIIQRETAHLKEALRIPGLTSKQQKEHIVRLIYCHMLGCDVSFSHMEAVKFAQQQHLLEKRVAYCAICLFLDAKNGSECMMMNIGSIQRDLASSNVMIKCFGLIAASKVVNEDMLPAVLPMVINLLKDKREVIRKKAVMTMLKFYEIDSNKDIDYLAIFHSILSDDRDPAVMAASLNCFHHFILADSAPFKTLVASFVSILKQIIMGKLPEEFNFKGVPAPWMQIKLLKILALLGCDDTLVSKQMYGILEKCLDYASNIQMIGCAVAYECMKTIATVYPNRALIEKAAGKAATFLQSNNYNLKYLGITALSDFIHVDDAYGIRHQMIVIDCLTDQDESLKRKSLDLLYHITNGSNVKVICEKLIIYLRSTTDEYVKSNLVLRITALAEKYSPDTEWFIETMNEVFEIGGNLVPVKVATNLMAIIGEGIEEEDDCDRATEELRSYAAMSYISILDKPILPDILVQLACWVVGEYFDLIEDYEVKDIINKLRKLMHHKFEDPVTQSWIVAAIMKVVSRADEEIILQDMDNSLSTEDARQRYREMKAAMEICKDLEEILPYDASCEDIEVDASLSFLDQFVHNARQNGAKEYSLENKQPVKKYDKTDDDKLVTLRHTPYPKPSIYSLQQQTKVNQLPVPSSVEKITPTLDSSVEERQKSQKWTRDGYMINERREESLSLEESSIVSSEPTSVNPDNSVCPSKSREIEEKIEKTPLTAALSRKEELALQLFGGANNVPKEQKRAKSNFARKPKMTSKHDIDLLGLEDGGGSLMNSASDHHSLMAEHTIKNVKDFQSCIENAPEDDLYCDMIANDLDTPSSQNVGIAESKEGTDFSHLMEMQNKDQRNFLLSEAGNKSANPLDDDISVPARTHETSKTSTVLKIPEKLEEYKCSSNQIQLFYNTHLRVLCQYVYKPTELAIALFLLNQSPHPLTEIQAIIKPPPNLKNNSPSVFHHPHLNSTSSCCHVILLSFISPALHMVLSVDIIYRDHTNTEKRIFVKHVILMSTLMRPFDIDIEIFRLKWQERSLYSNKKKLGCKKNMTQLVNLLQDLNFHCVKVIGNQVICAATILNKNEVLTHFEISQNACDISIKSASELLNDSMMKMMISVT